MAGMKMVMGAVAVVAGAVGAQLLKTKVVKRDEIFGLQTELALGLAGVLGGVYTGIPFLALAGAGALAMPAADKVLALVAGNGTAVAGWPYQIGELPRGGAMYALPYGAERSADNLAMSAFGQQ